MSYETTAFVIEGDSLDLCAGHANPNGMYHYHSTPGCLQEHAMVVAGLTPEEHSPQLGWSYVSSCTDPSTLEIGTTRVLER